MMVSESESRRSFPSILAWLRSRQSLFGGHNSKDNSTHSADGQRANHRHNHHHQGRRRPRHRRNFSTNDAHPDILSRPSTSSPSPSASSNATTAATSASDDTPTHNGLLMRLSLAKLVADDPTELKKLLKACRDLGAFYLDIRDTEMGGNLLSNVDKLFDIGGDIFQLNDDQKQRFEMSKFGGYYGYKGYHNRTRDFKEFYSVSKDDMLSTSCSPCSRPQPRPVKTSQPIIKTHINQSHAIISILLRHITTVLNLPSGSLVDIHRPSAGSGDQLRWIKIQPSQEQRALPSDEVLLDEHCDSNSITLLFNRQGGLQLRVPQVTSTTSSSPSTSASLADGHHTNTESEIQGVSHSSEGGNETAVRWIPARPLPGHCMILLGEQISRLTHGALRPSIHRVCVPSGAERSLARCSLVYFSRPEDDIILKQLAGVTVVPRPVLDGEGKQAENERKSKGIFHRRDWSGRWAKRKDQQEKKDEMTT